MALFPLLQTIYSFYKSSTLQLVRSELAALAVPAASPASSSTFTNKICSHNGTHNGIGYLIKVGLIQMEYVSAVGHKGPLLVEYVPTV